MIKMNIFEINNYNQINFVSRSHSKNMKKSISKLKPYFFSIIIGVIVYGFALTNFSLMVDSESPIYPDYSLGLGRWGTNLIRYHLFNGLLPYYTLLVGIIFLSLTGVEITKILKINGIYRYVFLMLFLSFPQHAYQMAFTMQADAISIGYFSASLAIGMFVGLVALKKHLYFIKLLIIIFLLIFSIAIYQALVFIPIVLYAIYFFTKLNEDGVDLKNEWKNLFIFIFILFISIIGYYISMRLFSPITESGYLSSYVSVHSSNRFVDFYHILKENLIGIFYYGNRPYILAFIGVFMSFPFFVIEKKNFVLKFFIFLFLLVFPFIMSFFITNGSHPPRLYVSSTLVFAFVIVFLLQKINLKYSNIILFIGLIIFLWNTYYVTNLFLSSNKIHKRDLILAQNINNYIKNNFDNFDPDVDYVYFYGKTPMKAYEKISLPKSDVFSGSLFQWDQGNNWRIINFFRFTDIAYYRFLDDETSFNRIKDSIFDMPAYPQNGSIRKMDNVIVIKLGFVKGVKLPFENEEENIPEIEKKKQLRIQEIFIQLDENTSIQGGLDNFNQSGNLINISGWIAYRYIPSKETEAFIYLYNNDNRFIVETNKVYRTGVSDYLADGTNYNTCGFTARFDVSELPKGTYEVGLRLLHSNSNMDYYKYGYNSIVVQ